MAIYQFFSVPSGSSLAFDPSVDVLNFQILNARSAPAAKINFSQLGADLIVSLGSALTVVLRNMSVGNLTTTNLTTEYGGVVMVGDNTIGTVDDDLPHQLTGTTGLDALIGFAGNDTLDGRAGGDRMSGGAGDDTYFIDDPNDVVFEAPGEGNDTLVSSINIALPQVSWGGSSEIENIVLVGAANAIGNSRNNTITGNSADNVLDGWFGADLLIGGAGNDTYIVENRGDSVVENPGEGVDTVRASFDYALSANLENLTLTGGFAIRGTGNAANNIIVVNNGDSVIDGGAGLDLASYATATGPVSINLGIVVAQATGGSGVDTLIDIENLIGSDFADVLVGNAGANTINGGKGADVMAGAGGNDSYTVDDTGDVVMELPGEGIMDSVSTTINYTLPDQVEHLVLIGIGNINGIGNALDNKITANAGINFIDGRGGIDTVSYITSGRAITADLSVHFATDAVTSDALFNVENLIGSNLNDNLTGDAGANTIEGGVGNDVMNGGAGVDAASYASATAGVTVDLRLSTPQNTIGAGTDTLSNFENLIGSAFNDNLTGNSADNALQGGAGADVLTGGAGNDVLIGGASADIFVLDSKVGADTITDFVSGGDKFRISQAGIHVGDGDGLVEGAALRAAPGGFLSTSELVIFTTNIAGTIDATSAAAQIGAATSAYASGATALFAVDNGSSSGLFLFTSSGADATVTAAELQMLALAQGTPSTAVSDYLFAL
jgi:Ca2+-binding RTX toxin-like protein